MSGVFIDTSALYAIFAASDGKHRDAVAIFRNLSRERATLVTTDLVLIESYVLVHARTGRTGLLRFRDAVGNSAWLETILATREHDARAWSLLEQRTDQEYSYVDATSFVVMRALGIERAFTFDEDFRREGFEVVGSRPGKS
jgi:uncharacterized protein